jgi:hypothetical protein
MRSLMARGGARRRARIVSPVTPRLGEIWVYLSASPLLGLTLTLLAYQAAFWLHKRCNGHPAANPVLLIGAGAGGDPVGDGHALPTYFEGAQFVHFLLGPATVALAIPLYAQLARLKRLALPLLLTLVAARSRRRCRRWQWRRPWAAAG